MQRRAAIKQGISLTIQESCAARYVTVRGKSVWMYSFCRMWIFHVRSAEARVTAKRQRKIYYTNKRKERYSLPQLMEMDVNTAILSCDGLKTVQQRLEVLQHLGLGYLTLGEETPSLSGGEAQRLKLASEMGKGQDDSVFIFDEPTIGLHPLDVQTLLQVFETLVQNGATVLVIEHDLDVMRNADYIIDMGPGGGEAGGRIVAVGTPGARSGKMRKV